MTYTKHEKNYMLLIESCLQFFNCARRKKLLVKYYVTADGNNKAKVLWGNVTIAEDLTIEQAHCFVWGFTRAKQGR